MRRLSCLRARRRLLAARDSGVGLAARLALDEHLAGCADCRAFDELDAALDQALTRLPEAPVERLDLEAQVRAVRAAVDERTRRVVQRRRRVLRTLAAAAALLPLASLLFVLARREREPLRAPGVAPVALEQASAAEPPEGSSPGSPAPAQEVALDLERLESARGRSRAALESAAGLAGSTGERLARLDLQLAELRDEGWPLARLVERGLDAPQAEVVALAARWLGRAGERLSLGPIAALMGDESRDLGLRAEALEALIELGGPARSALLEALEDADLRARALVALRLQGGADLVAELTRALREGPSAAPDEGRDLDLCAALADLGEAGIDGLVQVAARAAPASTRRVALATLERSGPALLQLAARLEERSARSQRAERLAVAARLGMSSALGHLLDAVFERRERRAALESLVEFRGPGAWSVLVDLWVSGRVPEDELLAAARQRLGSAGFEVAEAIELAQCRGDRAGLGAQLDLLLESELPAAAPALVQLAGCRGLEADQRQWAVLALLEVGGPEQIESLTSLLRSLAPDDLRLAAACTLTLYDLGGREAVALALGPAALQRSEDLAALFAARPANRNRAVTLSRASRLLEPWLDLENPERPRTDL